MNSQTIPVSKQAEYSRWFLIVVAIFMTCLFAANIISVKMITVFGLILPAGTIIFPVSYIFGDVLTEVYGYRKAKRVIWLGFFCNLLLVVVIYLAQILPSASFWDGQAAYEKILGFAPRLLFASFIAYLVGEFANSYILAKMKIATKGKWLWMRTVGSTLVGEGLDSMVFIMLAFYGTMPLGALGSVILIQWLGKTFYEVIATPLTYVVVNFLKRKEGIDTYDYETNFSPFVVTE